MAKTKSQINTKNNQEIVVKTTERGDNAIKADLQDTLDINMADLSANEIINHIEKVLFPIQSGKILWFNTNKGVGYITPSIEGSKSLIFECSNNTFSSGENVNYIELNNQAIVTEPGRVKLAKESKEGKNNKGKIGMVFVTPENPDRKDVVVKKNDTNIDLDNFMEGDKVEFVANKKGLIVAIKKAE